MDNMEQLAFLKSVTEIVKEIVVDAVRNRPYGIVHESHEVSIGGKDGLLVWDYIIWNELTFEEFDTGRKRSLFNSISDTETKTRFELLVEKYGK